jgi:hypothetical protein
MSRIWGCFICRLQPANLLPVVHFVIKQTVKPDPGSGFVGALLPYRTRNVSHLGQHIENDFLERSVGLPVEQMTMNPYILLLISNN